MSNIFIQTLTQTTIKNDVEAFVMFKSLTFDDIWQIQSWEWLVYIKETCIRWDMALQYVYK